MENEESEVIEYKESLSEKEEGGETLVAFANKNGGELYFGVKNNGEIKGLITPSEKTIRQLSELYVDNTEPKLSPTIEIISIRGLEVIKVTVKKSPTPHHTYRNKPYNSGCISHKVNATTRISAPFDSVQRIKSRFFFEKDRRTKYK